MDGKHLALSLVSSNSHGKQVSKLIHIYAYGWENLSYFEKYLVAIS